MELAEWVWVSFHPGEEITAQELSGEASRLLSRCDENGTLARDAFRQYYADKNRLQQEQKDEEQYLNPQNSLDPDELPNDPDKHRDRIWPLHETETADSPAIQIFRKIKKENRLAPAANPRHLP